MDDLSERYERMQYETAWRAAHDNMPCENGWRGWQLARAALSEQAAGAVPAGYALVPVEPTPDILDALFMNERDARAAWAAVMKAPATATPPQPAASEPVAVFDLTAARNIVVSAIRRMRAAHVVCLDLENEAEDFLHATHAAAKTDELWDQTLRDRDRYHDVADELAQAIARHTGVDIGEHSSANCPWEQALDAIAAMPNTNGRDVAHSKKGEAFKYDATRTVSEAAEALLLKIIKDDEHLCRYVEKKAKLSGKSLREQIKVALNG